MSTDGPVPYLDGHCSTNHGRPDQFHHMCPQRIRTQFGVELACSCEAHTKEEGAD